MKRKKKKKKKDENLLEKVVLATATIELLEHLIELLNKLLESYTF